MLARRAYGAACSGSTRRGAQAGGATSCTRQCCGRRPGGRKVPRAGAYTRGAQGSPVVSGWQAAATLSAVGVSPSTSRSRRSPVLQQRGTNSGGGARGPPAPAAAPPVPTKLSAQSASNIMYGRAFPLSVFSLRATVCHTELCLSLTGEYRGHVARGAAAALARRVLSCVCLDANCRPPPAASGVAAAVAACSAGDGRADRLGRAPRTHCPSVLLSCDVVCDTNY